MKTTFCQRLAKLTNYSIKSNVSLSLEEIDHICEALEIDYTTSIDDLRNLGDMAGLFFTPLACEAAGRNDTDEYLRLTRLYCAISEVIGKAIKSINA